MATHHHRTTLVQYNLITGMAASADPRWVRFPLSVLAVFTNPFSLSPSLWAGPTPWAPPWPHTTEPSAPPPCFDPHVVVFVCASPSVLSRLFFFCFQTHDLGALP
ncbi:hypothetical protein BHE74_00048028 [Ensete ventricosum]|nr:hypothetical protein BHE74_00048028 [Ensete ventricosum]